MVLTARLAGDGDVMIEYGEITATIKVHHEKAARLTALCKEMERVRLDTLRAEQERQTCRGGRDGEGQGTEGSQRIKRVA